MGSTGTVTYSVGMDVFVLQFQNDTNQRKNPSPQEPRFGSQTRPQRFLGIECTVLRTCPMRKIIKKSSVFPSVRLGGT